MRRLSLLLVAVLLALFAVPAPSAAGAQDPRRIGRVAVKEDGFYRVTPESLARLGARHPNRVSVTRRGRPVACTSSHDGIVFLAVDHHTDASAFGVYEIWLHDGTAPRTVPADTVMHTDRRRPPTAERDLDADRVHGPLEAAREKVYDQVRAPTWFLARIPPGGSVATDLDPAGAVEGEEQGLFVTLWATRLGPVAVRARWGEADLGVSTAATGARGAVLEWRVPAASVPAEGTALLLTDVSPPAPPPESQDISDNRGTLWIDRIGLRGAVVPVFDGHLRRFDLRGDLELHSTAGSGTRTLHLAALDSSNAPVPAGWRWGPTEQDHVRVETEGVPSPATLYASAHATDVEPEAVRERADPLARVERAKHLILAVPELEKAAKTLAGYRLAHGMFSAVVPVTDVYDAYGWGEPSAAAIRAFLIDVQRREGSEVRYVLLAGDATLDRTDMAPFPVIPAPMARTKYNGATAADRLYALPPEGSPTGGLEIGRLPFREASQMEAYVKRLIAYERTPPADATRRLLRFVTNESRFGPLIDRLLQTMFATVVTNHVPPAFDVETTFASKASPYLWPPLEMDDHVIQGLNDGCLFFTYVGHGSGRRFDMLRIGKKRFPVLHVDHAPRIACRGTPPIVFVIACTTAIFDHPAYAGVGETLLARPNGPIAYWGATRICHPAANVLFGRAITKYVAKREKGWRLGDILGHARDEVIDPPDTDKMRGMIDLAIGQLAKGSDPRRLALEGSWMYSLLGDPALQVAFPKPDVEVKAEVTDDEVAVDLAAPLPDGTELFVSLEAPRNDPWRKPEKVKDPLDPAAAAQIRENHRRVNDLAYVRDTVTLEDGKATWTAKLPEGIREKSPSLRKVVVKAWAIAENDVHQGGVMLEVPEAPPKTD